MKWQLSKTTSIVIFGLLILSGVFFGVSGLFGTSSSPAVRLASHDILKGQDRAAGEEAGSSESIPFSTEMNAEQVRKMVTGTWVSSYYGTRYLTIDEAGTAIIYYQPNAIARFVVGKQLTIYYDWDYDKESTQVVFSTTGGFPEESYQYVLKKWGTKQQQTVIDASEEMLLLLDTDGKTEHHWKRIVEIPESILKKFQAE